MNNLDLSCDVYRRWLKVGQLIPEGKWKILDVGGNPNDDKIKMFIPHMIVSIDPVYNTGDGTKLDYPDNSFDFVISIDTLEHVDPADRETFVSEMIRVAKYRAILACPFDEPFVADMEKAVYDITGNAFLKQHIELGLPSLTKVCSWLHDYDFNVYDNDSLISWASYILLNQLAGGTGIRDGKEYINFKNVVNSIYNPDDDLKISYRKVIEIIKDFDIGKSVLEDETPAKMVSIVIPVLILDFLDECIKSIEKNTTYPNYEIIIVNDGGISDNLIEYLNKTPHKVVKLEDNVGFGAANNAGFEIANGEYLVTLNSDTLVSPNWLTTLVKTIESADDVGIVYPTQIKMGTNTIVGDKWELVTKNLTSSLFSSVNEGKEYDQSKETVFEAKVAPGACFLIKRNLFFDVGMFDESFYNGCEDYDLSFKITSRGYKILHAPTYIEHFVGYTRSKIAGINETLTENKKIFCDRWFPNKVNIASNKDEVVKRFFSTYGQYRTPELCAIQTGIPKDDCMEIFKKLQEDRVIGGYVFEAGVPPQKYMKSYIMQNFNNLLKDTAILEIGPGESPIFDYNEYPRWFGVDKNYDKNLGQINYSHRVTAKDKYKTDRMKVGSWENLSEVFPEGSFDLLVSSHSFEHVSQPIKALKEANKVLCEGGIMINFMPDGYVNDYSFRSEVTHTIYPTPEMISEFFEYAGGFSHIMIMPFRTCYDIVVVAKKNTKTPDSKVTVVQSKIVIGGDSTEKIESESAVTVNTPIKSRNPIIKKGTETITVIDSTYQNRYADRNIQKLEAIKLNLNIENRNILDIGCNNGFFTLNLAEKARLIYGVEIDEKALEEASKVKNSDPDKYKNVTLWCNDITKGWDFNSYKPDITLFMSVYHHMCNSIGLDKAREVLKKIADNTTTLVFESGQHGEVGSYSWMDKLPENFSTYDDIVEEIKSVTGFTQFKKAAEIDMHGIKRFLVLCER